MHENGGFSGFFRCRSREMPVEPPFAAENSVFNECLERSNGYRSRFRDAYAETRPNRGFHRYEHLRIAPQKLACVLATLPDAFAREAEP
jgi:hypothetical protein